MFQDLPVWLTSLLVALLTSFITEVVTNTATCTLVLPIIAQLVSTMSLYSKVPILRQPMVFVKSGLYIVKNLIW